MPAAPVRIIRDWRVTGRLADVVRLLTEVAEFPRWWGDVHAAVVPHRPDRFAARSRRVLALGWHARVVEAAPPHGLVFEARGGRHGHGIWHLRQAGEVVEIAFDWHPTHRTLLGPLLGWLTVWLTVWSHRRAMARGQSALYAEISRINRLGQRSSPADHALQDGQTGNPRIRAGHPTVKILPDPPAQPTGLTAIQ